jgi:hypothetical protein
MDVHTFPNVYAHRDAHTHTYTHTHRDRSYTLKTNFTIKETIASYFEGLIQRNNKTEIMVTWLLIGWWFLPVSYAIAKRSPKKKFMMTSLFTALWWVAVVYLSYALL